jgi:uncharacterized protein YjbI with pentapeptide repeats
MANYTHLRILLQGVHVWNSWRRNRSFISPDLSGADLTNRDLAGADFSNTNLDGTDFTNTNLVGARFIGATLKGTAGLA